ncbi:hypothetical protein [Candidatus Nanohalovita haloferacivicina]|uniref:hypothetical protein n=1 Tax=Candidatus Nanohalovita haloferacivicina TaxID=2978046 RepID=UPI00325FC947|nr:hypothetical protein HBNXNv_0885 [Candidatus Nanohalobia archaeon BNXNv]
MVNNIWDRLLDESKRTRSLPGQLRFLRKTSEADNIALMGSDYNEKNFSDFEETVFENYSENNNARLFASEEYREAVEESDKIHEDSVFFFDYPAPSHQISDIFVNSINGDNTVAYGPREHIDELADFSPDRVKGFYRE